MVKIIKKKTNKDVYNKLEIEVLVNIDYTINDIIRFFIRHYAHPKKLASDIKEYQKTIGSIEEYFRNQDHNNMDLYSVERIVEAMTKHLISMSIINEAKTLFEEYVSNEK